MKKIITVLGARPQFIKAATLSRVLREKGFDEIIVHTGQHYDWNMSEVFFDEMQIPKPQYALNITSKHHGEMTGRMLAGVEEILLKEKPDILLVYGDTNSTLAGSLAASKLHLPIAHVEAGLRSYNRLMPEEINRVITDHISKWLFVPTDQAVDNLKKEGIHDDLIYRVGDVMYDALLFYQKLAESKSDILEKLELKDEPFVLITIHRAENTNNPERLKTIFDQLEALSKDRIVIFPLHPRTRSFLNRDYSSESFKIMDPVSYFDMILLQKKCRLIVTDSGGVQKEAFFNSKYCVTVREETEWIELVEHGFNCLAKPLSDLNSIIHRFWDKPFDSKGKMLYGKGNAAEEIAEILKK